MYDGVYELVEELQRLDNEAWDEYGFTSRPMGDDRRVYFECMLEKLEKSGIEPQDITDEAIEILEDENYHSLCNVLGVYTGNYSFEYALDMF